MLCQMCKSKACRTCSQLSNCCSHYLFNLFINDIDLVNCPDASLSKYLKYTMILTTTMQVICKQIRPELIVRVM